MITYNEALDIVLSHIYLFEKETVPLLESANRVLTEDVFSDINMPPFNRSAVDGYACRKADLVQPLEIIETIRAGSFPGKKVSPGKCARIMTGAPVPEGADCVIMVEETAEIEPGMIRFTGAETKTNISPFAEDVRKSDLVIKSGILIKPQHIAIMAAVGYVRPVVATRPKVTVISTGDEIVEPHLKPGPSQIRNSNGYQLTAQAEKAGTLPLYLGIAPDNEEDTYRAVLQALEKSDVVLLTGGVSMGTYDFVPGIMEQAGIEILFRTIAHQPGKPTIFGIKGQKRIFGLPGNPVSSFTVFEVLVKPMLWKMMGVTEPVRSLRLPLGADYQRMRSDRMQWLPVQILDGQAYPLEYHGSAHISALCGADGLVCVDVGVAEIEKGTIVQMRLM